MSDMRFFGKYAICRSENKSTGAHLIGPDNIVGNEVSLDFRNTDGKTVVWAVNKFGADIGYFDKQTSYLIDVTRSRGWKLHALISIIGLTDYIENNPEENGYYWAEIAVISFAPRYEDYAEKFLGVISKNLANGVRFEIDLVSSSIDLLLKNKGDWTPSKKLPQPPKKKGTVIIKKSRKPSETAIEAGRNRNKGCYFVSYLFIALLIIGIIFLIKAILGF